MIPPKSEKQYLISKAQENMILDDIGLYLKHTKNMTMEQLKTKGYYVMLSIIYTRDC